MNNSTFFIRQGSTLPKLIMQLVNDGRNDFRKFHEAIQDAEIYFNMYDAETNKKVISNQLATCTVKKGTEYTFNEEYYIVYSFREQDTKCKKGKYFGEFTIRFNNGDILKTPIRNNLIVYIN